MGLDMYLTGEKFLWTDWKNPENNQTEDGFRVKDRHLELGYWRKHPYLHGFIVKTFAEGIDECQRIDLDKDNMRTILEAVRSDKLPHTEGFFFGSSGSPTAAEEEDRKWYYERKEETIAILEKALAWLEAKEEGVSRSIFYQASW